MSEDIYKCKICDRQFPTSQGLNGHKRSHTKWKPFYPKCCSILTRKEIRADMLDQHEKKFIAKIKTCPNCGKLHIKPKFCSQSCSAAFNNKYRDKEQREAQRATLLKTLNTKPKKQHKP